jgi:hypothetical protein
VSEWLIIPCLLMAAVGFAAENAPSRLRWYFLAMFLSIIPQWAVAATLGETSKTYLVVYICATVAILFFVFLLTACDITQHPHPVWTIFGCSIVAACCFVVAKTAIPKPSVAQWIQLVEGFLLVACSGCVGLSAKFCGKYGEQMVGISLSIFWMLQGGFRLAFILHTDSRDWLIANAIIPPLLAIAFPSWIGLQLRRMHGAPVW